MTDEKKPEISLKGLPPLEDLLNAAGYSKNDPEEKSNLNNYNPNQNNFNDVILVAFRKEVTDKIHSINPLARPFVLASSDYKTQMPNYIKNLNEKYPSAEIAVLYNKGGFLVSDEELLAKGVSNLVNVTFIEIYSKHAKKTIDESCKFRSF